MPTQQELLDIMLRQRLLDQETGNTRALQARAGMQLPGPISSDQLQQMVAQSQLRKRMGVDPQAARFRKMLANPAQAPVDPNADTEADIARKARLGAMTLVGGMRYGPGEAPPAFIADKLGEERAKYREGSDYMQKRAARMERGSAAADASRAKSANLAFRRGVLNPTAETAYAQQGIIPDRQAMAVANRIALIQAMQPKHATGNPIQAGLAGDPEVMAALKKRLIAGGDPSAEIPAEPGSLPVPPPTTKIVGRGMITTTPPNPNLPAAPSGQPTGLIKIGPDGTKYYRDGSGKVTIVKPGGLVPGDVQPAPFW